MKNTKQKHSEFILNGAVHSTETRGVHVNIIDYSLSRLEIGESKAIFYLYCISFLKLMCVNTLFLYLLFFFLDGLTVSCDISADEELFMGQGDYQFEIYRLMKKENKYVPLN